VISNFVCALTSERADRASFRKGGKVNLYHSFRKRKTMAEEEEGRKEEVGGEADRTKENQLIGEKEQLVPGLNEKLNPASTRYIHKCS
jgi:hypothetical protein